MGQRSSPRRWLTAGCWPRRGRAWRTRRCWSATARSYLAALLRPLVGSLDAVSADGAASKRGKGAYTLLVVDGAARPAASFAALLAEGGRIVTGVLERGVTRLAVGTQVGGEITLLPVADMGIPVIAEFRAPKRSWNF